MDVMAKKVSIPHQSRALSSCGCEKSHVGLCSSDLVTPTPSPEGYKSLRQAQLLSSDNCQSNCVLRLLFVPPGMSCLAINLKRGQ